MVKFISANEAIKFFKSGQKIMIGGFLNCGAPTMVIDEILKTNLNDFTLISNDTSFPETDRGKLIANKRVKKAIVSHIGTNSETVNQMNAGTLSVELVPQGTLAERVRAGGAGLGGILTPVGLGTDVAKGKEIVKVDGVDFLLEKPLKADVAIVYATHADKFGNLSFFGSTKNFNAIMPPAADVVIAEVDNLYDEPIDPNHVVVPGIFVDYLILKK
ncbi:MAG: CoA transferase subunit A [Alphaproteobacteria bacterium]|nr:CoA transferase subunit A [Alphaproteobacteria bacterium]